MQPRILYISDLDGTLLRKDQTISPFTAETLGRLTEKGLLFSYATARSYTTASKVTANLPFQIPVIVFNGSFIVDPRTENRLFSAIFTPAETKLILDTLLQYDIFPVVNAFIENRERFSYVSGKETRGILTFLDQRKNDVRRRPLSDAKGLYGGEVFHIACIDEEEKLRPLYERFKNEFPCVLYRDVYSGDTWLELHPKGATKASAILTLKKMLNCDAVVCFGDGKNDISMFRIANECYAVANAEPELKAIATAVIEDHEADGVAKWLAEHAIFA
ncbi:MAG: HAD family hydrolase [Clostridia bacterium]|nr:HAD family hydrolase [Clostridia bacterium]